MALEIIVKDSLDTAIQKLTLRRRISLDKMVNLLSLDLMMETFIYGRERQI